MLKWLKKLGKVNVTVEKAKKKPNLLEEIKNEPDKFMLMAYIENDEVVVKIKRRVDQ